MQEDIEIGTATKRKTILTTSMTGVGGTLLALAHSGPAGLFFGTLITAGLLALENHGTPEEYTAVARHLGPAIRWIRRSRQHAEPMDAELSMQAQALQNEEETTIPQTEEMLPAFFTFSSVLSGFTPTLQNIFLAFLDDGTPVSTDAKGLCHVALAGATGGGKTSLVRLLLCQLCKAGASVLLLNPHYTHYDLEQDEDWTPFEPYLVYDPMECRKYEVIEFYLKQVATELLPKRLEKYANSRPLGKPYFLALDELPAIVKHVPDAPEYLSDILREGRKVGIYLITAAQDFLVKTVMGNNGTGAVRDCFRTAYYVGGDAQTARVLLDVRGGVDDGTLGAGRVMLRCKQVKQAALARVPYVDNQALYSLLGPSTYVPARAVIQDDEPRLEDLRPGQHAPENIEQPARAKALPSRLQQALNIYEPGMGCRPLSRAMGIGKDAAADILRELRERRLID